MPSHSICATYHLPFSRQGGTIGTTTPLPNGLIEEIIDDEMATMNWEPGTMNRKGWALTVTGQLLDAPNHALL